MRVYISGPITGTQDYERRFAEAEMRLRACGYDVVNPVRLNGIVPSGTDWEGYMRLSICLLGLCDRIYMLPGWKKSRGACMEYGYALGHGIAVYDYGKKQNH